MANFLTADQYPQLMDQDGNGVGESGPLVSAALQPSAEPSPFEESRSPNSGEIHGTFQQFVYEDQRQVHIHAPSPDPALVAAASQGVMTARDMAAQVVFDAQSQSMEVRDAAAHAVLEARTETLEVREQAAQAVVEARSQTMEVGMASHVQITALREELTRRDAALAIATERIRVLQMQLNERVQEIEQLRAALLNDPNGTGNLTVLFESRIKYIEESLNQMRIRPHHSFEPRIGSCERKIDFVGKRMDKILHEIIEDRSRFQDLHAQFQTWQQDQWWDQPEGIVSPKGQSPKNHQGPSNPEEFDLFGDGENDAES